MAADYPGATPSFTTLANNVDYIDASHVNRLREEVVALAANLRAAFPAATAAIGGQFKFPATQAASTDANTLDDYEEGTFTPVLNFGGATTGITYGTQVGTYVKVGQMVCVTIHLVLTNKGSATGAATITGLPFSTHSGGFAGLGVHTVANLGVSVASFSAYMGTSSTTVNLQYIPAAGGTGSTNAIETSFSNTTTLVITGSYRASA